MSKNLCVHAFPVMFAFVEQTQTSQEKHAHSDTVTQRPLLELHTNHKTINNYTSLNRHGFIQIICTEELGEAKDLW